MFRALSQWLAASTTAREWSESEFGDAGLDVRNRARLVRIGAAVAESVNVSTIAHAFPDRGELHGAYDFLEHKRVLAEPIIRASSRACALRSAEHSRVLIPIDGSSLSLRDPHHTRGTGPIGRRTSKGRGLKMIVAGGYTERGVALGLAGMICWTRSEKASRRTHKQRPVAERETQHQLDIRARVRANFGEHAPDTEYVFIEDRGGDAWAVLTDCFNDRPTREHSIIRAAHDRRAVNGHKELQAVPCTRLDQITRRAPLRGKYKLQLSTTRTRSERDAKIEVRSAPITIDLITTLKRHEQVQLWVVHAREVGRVPRGQSRVEWTLLTDLESMTLSQARYVIDAYTQRWRIEDFFKVLKGGVIDIESTRLHSVTAIEKWLAIQSANAMRIQRLARLIRTEPETPARKEFSDDEIEAARDLYAAQKRTFADEPTVLQLAMVLANIAGSHRAAGELPGAIVLARGLERVLIVASAMRGRADRAPPAPAKRKRQNK